jgi:hypothetical protein
MAIITINGRDLAYYGVTLLDGGYAALLTPPDIKEWVTNDDPRKDGVEYITPSTIRVKERSVNLIFHIAGSTEAEFLSRLNSFVSLLQSGMVKFYFGDLRQAYTLKYESCTSFDQFGLKMCKLAVKFTEPNPKDKTRDI